MAGEVCPCELPGKLPRLQLLVGLVGSHRMEITLIKLLVPGHQSEPVQLPQPAAARLLIDCWRPFDKVRKERQRQSPAANCQQTEPAHFQNSISIRSLVPCVAFGCCSFPFQSSVKIEAGLNHNQAACHHLFDRRARLQGSLSQARPHALWGDILPISPPPARSRYPSRIPLKIP